MNILDIHYIVFTILGYKVSFIELSGTVSGMLCVWLTAREKVSCWPIGILNIILFFIMFYQVNLYSDMLLQVYFLITSFYGWWMWTHPQTESLANENNELKITNLTNQSRAIVISLSLAGTTLLGTFMTSVHELLPTLFPERAAYPYADAFTTVFSITAQLIMTVKKRECWILWMTVDTVATVVYFMKGINLVAIEYMIFWIIAFSGLISWTREMKRYDSGDEQ